MFGNSEVWWVGLLVFIIFLSVNLILSLLRNKPKIAYAIIYCVAVYFLIFKTAEYIRWQAKGRHLHFPVEISALAYFIIGITIVFRIKKLNAFVSFIAIIAGLVYSVTFWFLPENFTDGNFHRYLIMAIINHHLLYFCGMIIVLNIEKFDLKKFYVVLLGVAVLIAYSWIIHLFTNYTAVEGKPVIIEITDGTILSYVFTSYSTAVKILYIVCAIILFFALLAGFYLLNGLAVKRRKNNGLNENCYPASLKSAFTFKRGKD